MAIQTEFVNLSVSDGTTMRAYVAHPEGAPRAGIMVFQEIFGVNAHIRDVTERFAREGYLAVAPEVFHRTGPGFESGYTDMNPGRTHAQATTDDGLDVTRAAHAAGFLRRARFEALYLTQFGETPHQTWVRGLAATAPPRGPAAGATAALAALAARLEALSPRERQRANPHSSRSSMACTRPTKDVSSSAGPTFW